MHIPITAGFGWLSEHDLGTSEPCVDDYPGFSVPGVYGDTKALTYLTAYQRVPDFLLAHTHIARVQLTSEWFLTEIEQAIRSTFFLNTLLVIEPPTEVNDDAFEHGTFREGDAGYSYIFYSSRTALTLLDHFGDVISGRDVLLLPHLNTAGPARHSPNSYNDFYRCVEPGWKTLASSSLVAFEEPSYFSPDIQEPGVPYLFGGNLRDLLSLRRNEHETFTNWHRHIRECLASTNPSPRELREALV